MPTWQQAKKWNRLTSSWLSYMYVSDSYSQTNGGTYECECVALDETYIRFHLPLIPKQYSLMYATEPRRACSGTRKALLLVC